MVQDINNNVIIKNDENIDLKINVSYVGIFEIEYKNNNYNKSISSDIKLLECTSSKNKEDALEKIQKLFDIICNSHFESISFQRYKKGHDIKNELFEIAKNKNIEITYIDELSNDEPPHPNTINYYLNNRKLRWWLLFVAGILIGCDLGFGIKNAFQGKIPLAIFLFITVLAGFVASIIGHYDFFKKVKKNIRKELIITLLFDFIPSGMGFGIFIAIFSSTTSEKSIVTLKQLLSICVPIILSLIALSWLVSYILTKYIKPKNVK